MGVLCSGWKQVLLAVAALALGGAGTADAALTTGSGTLSGAAIKGAVRYRSFNSSGSKEVYLDAPNLVLNPDTSCCAAGVSADVAWGTPTRTWTIAYEYDGSQLRSVVSQGTTQVSTAKAVGSLGSLNYLAFETLVGNANRRVELQSVRVFKGAVDLGQVWATSGTSAGLNQLYATGEDLSGGFRVTASLVITGSPQPGGDSNYVQIRVGYVTPPDTTAPVVSNVRLTPATPLLNGGATLEAGVDDSTTGGSTIAEASYQLNADAWAAMAAADGAFDEVAEDVEASIGPLTTIGINEVCVTAKDSAGNASGTSEAGPHHPCLAFAVAYAFDGFFRPVDNTYSNDARAGQAVPFKWRLTDANGDPVSDPASFAGFFSYPIDCDSLQGQVADAIEEYAAGSSGLQYDGDGYWQFNWKTSRAYAATCRAAYVQFNSTQTSPVVTFQFRK